MAKNTTTIKWSGKAVNAATRKLVSKKVRQSTFLVLGDAAMNAPVVSGRYRNSIDTHFEEFLGITYSNVEYAPDIELGTEPHIIRIKDKKVLSNGKFFFGKEVHHPGTKAQYVFTNALFDNEENIKRIFNDNKL